MKVTRLLIVMLMMVLLCVFFVSLPVLADDGDEDPWDADGGGNNGGTTENGGGIADGHHSLRTIVPQSESSDGLFINLLFRLSYDVGTYFYDNYYGISTKQLIQGKERGESVGLSRNSRSFSEAR